MKTKARQLGSRRISQITFVRQDDFTNGCMAITYTPNNFTAIILKYLTSKIFLSKLYFVRCMHLVTGFVGQICQVIRGYLLLQRSLAQGV